MSGFLGSAARSFALVGDDVLTAGINVARDNANQPKKQKIRRRALVTTPTPGPVGQTALKQEASTMSVVKTPEEVKVMLETELAKMLELQPTAEGKSLLLYKMGIYRDELMKMAPLIADVDEDLSDQVLTEWFSGDDGDLRRCVFNACAGAEEIELRKEAPADDASLALAKMIQDAPDDAARGRLLSKIQFLKRDYEEGVAAIVNLSEEDKTRLTKAWVETGGDREIKDALVKAAPIYGSGQAPENPVSQVVGNASTQSGAELGDSAGGPDTGGARLIPRAPKGSGAGRKMDGDAGEMPNGGAGKTTDAGSGPNDTGGGEAVVGKKLRRKTTTGGLGNSAGADSTQARQTTKQDDDIGKAELIDGLIKIAPPEMIEALSKMTPEDQVEICEIAGAHTADLLAWNDAQDPSTLQKAEMDQAVTDWLTDDPDSLQIKQWCAEALATAEEIPLELGKAIMSWTPPRSVRIRRLVTA